jgi:hypothetical protein
MLKTILLSVIFVGLIYAQTRKATCVFDENAFSTVKGYVNITYDGTKSSFSVTLTGTTALADDNNNLHVHQLGVTKDTKSCAEVLKHYNPVKDYGELSGKWGFISRTVVKTFDSPDIKLDGEYNILGRGIVLHNSSMGGPRVACCTIRLVEDSIPTFAPYTDAVLTCHTAGVIYTLSTAGALTINVTDVTTLYANNSLELHKYGSNDCASSGTTDTTVTLPTFPNTVGIVTGNIGKNVNFAAGRTLVRKDATDATKTGDCCVLTQTVFQTNVNDAYTAPTTTSATSSTDSGTTGASSVLFVSLLFIFVVLFF